MYSFPDLPFLMGHVSWYINKQTSEYWALKIRTLYTDDYLTS